MRRLLAARFLILIAALGIAPLLLAGCTDDNEDVRTIAITLDDATVSLPQGGSVTTSVSASELAIDSPDITFSVKDLPAGVSASLGNREVSGNTSTTSITFSATTTATPGDYGVTVVARSADGTVQDELIQVTVIAVTYTIAAAPTTLSIPQGGNGTILLTIARIGGYNKAVAFSSVGDPIGMTVTFTPQSATGNNSTMSIAASSTLAPGIYPISVFDQSPDFSGTTPVVVTVTAVPSFSIGLNPSSLTLPQGNTTNATVTLTRTGGFSGAVALAASGLPSGVTASFSPASVTGNTSTMTLTGTAGATVGPNTFSLTGSSGLLSIPLSVPLTVSASGTPVTFDLGVCTSFGPILFAAYQDGSGPWVPLTASGSLYSTTLNGTTAGFTYVSTGSGSFTTLVQYYSKSELLSGPKAVCAPTGAGSKMVTGTTTGLTAGEQGRVGFGGATNLITSGVTNLTLFNVLTGLQDLVGYKSSSTNLGVSNRGILIPGLNPAAGGSLGLVDFNGANSFAPQSATLTVANPLGGESVLASMGLSTSAACVPGSLWSVSGISSPFAIFGVPTGLLRTTDFHMLTVDATTATTDRSDVEWFHAMGSHTVTLPNNISGLSVSAVGGAPYKTLQATLTAPLDISNAESQMRYNDVGASSHSGVVGASAAFLSGRGTFPLMMPDLSGLVGWNNSWMPAPSATVNWSVTTSTSGAGSPCTEGGSFKSVRASGSN